MMNCRVLFLKLPAIGREICYAAYGCERCCKLITILGRALEIEAETYDTLPAVPAVEFIPSRLMDGRAEAFPDRMEMPAAFRGEIRYRDADCRFLVGLEQKVFKVPASFMLLKRAVAFGVLPLLLEGKAFLIHGALLELPGEDGRGVVIYGESTAGKSTAARRFAANGGRALADDQVLMTLDDSGEFWAQPLPTWSEWAFSPPGGTPVPGGKAVRVEALLLLTRGEKDRVVPAVAWQWKCWLVRALNAHLLHPEPGLPGKLRVVVAERIMDIAAQLQRRFGCYELQAGLRGDLLKCLKWFLDKKWNQEEGAYVESVSSVGGRGDRPALQHSAGREPRPASQHPGDLGTAECLL